MLDVGPSIREIIFSLAAAHVVAHVSHAKPIRTIMSSPAILCPLGVWLVFTCIQSYATGELLLVDSLGMEQLFISYLFLVPLVWLLACGVWAGHRLDKQCQPLLGPVRIGVVFVGSAMLSMFCPSVPTFASVLKLWLLTIAHLIACALDCMCSSPVCPLQFLHSLSRALAYVAPAYPLIVVAASAMLLLATSMLWLIRIDPVQIHFLIKFMAVYSPFWCVHRKTKLLCSGYMLLPCVDTTFDLLYVRRARLSMFTRFCI
mmetsp:Transcript_63139/g.104986  ORF Transcript_63139/g.104986 Transcript_63139/m.104986 type:complete len:259 (+) Transcript_63139:195-971(+)